MTETNAGASMAAGKAEAVKQLLLINAQMFEGTIRVLSQQNMHLHQQLSVLLQQVTELTAAHTKLLQDLAVEGLVKFLDK